MNSHEIENSTKETWFWIEVDFLAILYKDSYIVMQIKDAKINVPSAFYDNILIQILIFVFTLKTDYAPSNYLERLYVSWIESGPNWMEYH